MAGRTLTSAIDSALDDAAICEVKFVSLAFDDGTLRLHTDLASITWGGNTWTGIGTVGSIDTIEERVDGSPSGTTLRLSGLDSTLVNECLSQNVYERAVKIYLGVRDPITGAMLSDPAPIFSGKMDQMRMISGSDLSTVEVAVESEEIDRNKSAMRWFSDNQLQVDYPGDLAFQYMAAMTNLKITIGSKQTILFGAPPVQAPPTFTQPVPHFFR